MSESSTKIGCILISSALDLRVLILQLLHLCSRISLHSLNGKDIITLAIQFYTTGIGRMDKIMDFGCESRGFESSRCSMIPFMKMIYVVVSSLKKAKDKSHISA